MDCPATLENVQSDQNHPQSDRISDSASVLEHHFRFAPNRWTKQDRAHSGLQFIKHRERVLKFHFTTWPDQPSFNQL